jgi:hypothetical protein
MSGLRVLGATYSPIPVYNLKVINPVYISVYNLSYNF